MTDFKRFQDGDDVAVIDTDEIISVQVGLTGQGSVTFKNGVTIECPNAIATQVTNYIESDPVFDETDNANDTKPFILPTPDSIHESLKAASRALSQIQQNNSEQTP